MLLLPKENTGVFISYNGEGAKTSRIEFIIKFMDYFYPTAGENTSAESSSKSSDISGPYKLTKSPYTTIEKYLSRSNSYYNVKLQDNCSMYITDGNCQISELIPAEYPLKFKCINGSNGLLGDVFFKANKDSQITSFSGGNVYIYTYERVP